MIMATSKTELIDRMMNRQPSYGDAYPDMGLYMEQVITLLESQLSVDEGITANMINNYVKDGYIPRPAQKKYYRDQVLRLSILFQLKSVLPISVLGKCLSDIGLEGEMTAFFGRLSGLQEEGLRTLGDKLERDFAKIQENPNEARLVALRLATEANALRTASLTILASLETGETSREKTE